MLILMMLMLMLFIVFLNKNLIFSMKLINMTNLSMDLNFSNFNLIFSFIVIFISVGVIFYSKLYFMFNLDLKYKLNLILFILSMILLINSNNFLMIMMGWDGLGISSFFLISFYSNLNSSISSLITFFFNRLGDSMMIIFISTMIYKSLKTMMMNLSLILLIILLIGVITKSSQVPFGVWLPMAMSAPTPISSLVHSSTLVTAGIFIFMKMDFILNLMEVSFLIMNLSMMTFILGGLFSVFMMDMKKSIAFSTLSQLGFILFSISLGNFLISFYHLIFHALFKSSLFINLGIIMIYNNSNQDTRQFSMNLLKLIKFIFIISCLNLMGFISSIGFISKDMILMFFFNKMNKIMINIFLYLGCMITSLYSMKFIYFLMEKKMKMMKIILKIKMNLLFYGMIISLVVMMMIPNFMMNLFIMEFEIFIFVSLKYKFYLIILISIILFKFLILNLNLLMLIFSSMLMMLDKINLLLNKLLVMNFKKLMSYIMIEEFIQLNIMNLIYTKFLLKLKFLIIFSNLVLMMFLSNIMLKFWYMEFIYNKFSF